MKNDANASTFIAKCIVHSYIPSVKQLSKTLMISTCTCTCISIKKTYMYLTVVASYLRIHTCTMCMYVYKVHVYAHMYSHFLYLSTIWFIRLSDSPTLVSKQSNKETITGHKLWVIRRESACKLYRILHWNLWASWKVGLWDLEGVGSWRLFISSDVSNTWDVSVDVHVHVHWCTHNNTPPSLYMYVHVLLYTVHVHVHMYRVHVLVHFTCVYITRKIW